MSKRGIKLYLEDIENSIRKIEKYTREEIKGTRNKVVHEYFGVDEEILWKTIQEDLPVFKKQVAKLFNGS